jgi:sigma-E factor negative regulatory protein RseC
MICEQSVEIIEITSSSIWVKPVPQQLCAACAPSGRCRADWLSATFGAKKTFEIPIDAPISVEVGDQIQVWIESSGVSMAVARVYGLPLAGVLGGAWIGVHLGWGDAATLLSMLVGFGGCVLIARIWKNDVRVKVKQ